MNKTPTVQNIIKYGELINFIEESNRIEDILKKPSLAEIQAHQEILDMTVIGRKDIEKFVWDIAKVEIRSRVGMNVIVGNYTPPSGGPTIINALEHLLISFNSENSLSYDVYQNHISYEKLHPFMDCNGRSGRVLWAWQMRNLGYNPFSLPFLHSFYYQTLDLEHLGE